VRGRTKAYQKSVQRTGSGLTFLQPTSSTYTNDHQQTNSSPHSPQYIDLMSLSLRRALLLDSSFHALILYGGTSCGFRGSRRLKIYPTLFGERLQSLVNAARSCDSVADGTALVTQKGAVIACAARWGRWLLAPWLSKWTWKGMRVINCKIWWRTSK